MTLKKIKIKIGIWFAQGIVQAIKEKKLNWRTRIAIMEVDKMLKGSWKTTATGIGMVLAGISGAAGMAAMVLKQGVGIIDEKFIQGFMLSMGSISGGIGLICARDNGVTSEQAGAKPEVLK